MPELSTIFEFCMLIWNSTLLQELVMHSVKLKYIAFHMANCLQIGIGYSFNASQPVLYLFLVFGANPESKMASPVHHCFTNDNMGNDTSLV